MSRYVGAIDQGTTSSRFIVFDKTGSVVGLAQKEHEQIFPRPGWVEHDPQEIWRNTTDVIAGALENAGISARDLAAVGITNQRETTLVWDRHSGAPIHNALVWQDTRADEICAQLARSGGRDRLRDSTGLPLASYFSGPKLRWLIENVAGARERANDGELLFGTIDSWLIWQLTGGVRGGRHVTDVTNASRTQLMSLATLQWDAELLGIFDVPASLLPEILPSSGVIAETTIGALRGVPICGIAGDQQAALLGQACFEPGEAKNTYGTGCFMLMNTGEVPVRSNSGLATTVAYRLGEAPAHYALEGSIAITGSLVQWLRDNLGLIESSGDVEALAKTVEDNGDVYFVPAFSGLYAPHWRDDARGIIAGLTRYANRGHIARATLEATAYQTREVLEAMQQDSGVAITELRVDGGMVANDLLMQFQADMIAAPVVSPKVIETTALGAAYAAGLACGYWSGIGELRENWQIARRWEPKMADAERSKLYAAWQKAVTRSFGWIE
ncbi:MAG: glycerol kinase GlpK [Gammaproteobacteria bacterium]|jgi:glycerol kinase